MPQTHTAVTGSKRNPLPQSRVLGRTNQHATIEVILKLRRKKELPDLAKRPAGYMTREALAAEYGASEADIKQVVDVFGRYGLKPVDVNAATRTVRLSGTVAEMESAFLVTLFNYAHPSGPYRGRVGEVHVPNELKDIVKGVFGLDNRRVAYRRGRAPATVHARSLTSIPSSWYTPAELASHYNFPPGDGTGQTVGILEFGGGYFEQDLQKFCKLAKVSVPQVTAISTDGTPTTNKDGAEGEVMLDIEVVAGVCPNAAILVYFASWGDQGWVTALDAVMSGKDGDPAVVSISWGFAEGNDIWTTQAMDQVNESLKEAALLGITICVAAGDDGSSDAITDGHAYVDFPSSSIYALAVGGTTIPSKGSQQPDICWKEGDGLRSDNGGSTGGGVSAVFDRPDWQSQINVDSVNPGAIVGRCVPDVAANADWDASPYLLVVDGKAQANGGTSAAAPLWASLITRLNQNRGAGKRVGYLTPALYRAPDGTNNGPTVGAQGCTDVQSGNNITAVVGGYTAGAGYDLVSGWGTPNGVKLLAVLP